MEASALHAPALGRRTLSAPLLRLRSDEQLVALFRAGSEDAFAAMHDRYRQRLFAYVRQMLSVASRADADDVLQDVFVRAYGALRADEREVNLRAWLYRVAHNRCIDHLRRPTPPAGEVFDMSRTPPLQDPLEAAQRRDDLRRLVDDVGRLPDQQRSALLMREIDGLAYADIATALDVTLPAVKSLLVRARVGLVEAAEARDTDCAEIRADLLAAYDRGVKASGRARRHMRECDGCREYRGALRGMRRSFAALSPVAGLGPLALAAKALGIGGASGGAAAGGGALATGGGAIATGGAVTATACKVAAVVCTAVVATGGAVEVKKLADAPHPQRAEASAGAATATAPAPAPAAARSTATTLAAAPVSAATIRHRTGGEAAAGAVRDGDGAAAGGRDDDATAGGSTAVAVPIEDPDAPAGSGTTAPHAGTDAGGTTAPDATGGAKPPGGTTTGSSTTGTGTPGAGGSGAGATTGGGSAGGTGSPGTTTGATTGGGPAAEAPAADPPAAGTTAPPTTSGPPPEH